MAGGLESKTLMENPSDKAILSDGIRVSEEHKDLVGGSNSVTGTRGSGREGGEGGRLGINDKHDGSKNRVTEMMSGNNGWGSWGFMNLVGRVLDGKFSIAKEEVEHVKISENGPVVNQVRDSNTWHSVIVEPTHSNGIDIKGTQNDKDSDKLNSGCPFEGNGLNGHQDLVPNEMVPDGKLETVEVIDVEADVLTPRKRGEHLITEKEGECYASNLDGKVETEEVNDVKADLLTPRERGEYLITEKESEYGVSDLVWGKVRSHPWWPGQIFAPSDASDKATKYFKRDSYLIAYFGDQTFAWNEVTKINPFRMHFSQMEKQSNADGFCHAVGCALDEVSRRVELGLSCPCLPQEVRDKIKVQVVANTGIREESSRRAGGDNLSAAASFLPKELVQFLGSLAESPQSKADKLQYAIRKAQLLAFNRWKGHYQLPSLQEFGELLEDDGLFPVKGQGKDSWEVMEGFLPGPGSVDPSDFPSKKIKSTARDDSSRKRKRPSGDDKCPKIKEKYISALMSSSSSSLQNDEKKPAKRGRKPKYLTQRVEMIPAQIPTPDVILSKLILAAKNPMQGPNITISEIGLLRELRNSICVEKSSSRNEKQDAGPSNLKTTDTVGVEGTEDSYWTDRIIQTYSQDQVPSKTETSKERVAVLEANVSVALNLDNNKENPSLPMNEVTEEYCPTALILNFTNLESIPSITNLNEIFTRYGPLNESETKVFSKSKRAKVIFRRREDAETAFSSTGKYSIFGPSLVSYRLHYAPIPRTASKRSKKTDL